MISWVILVFGAFMFVCLMLFMPAIQAYMAVGENLTGVTANTTYWLSYGETINFFPITLMFLAIVIPIVAWWKAHKHGE